MTSLRKTLSTFDLTMIAVGGTIGSGIFLTPSLIAQQLPSASLILAVWIAGGIVSLAGALTFAELGGMYPRAGGMYAYLTAGYGPMAGFLFGWAYLLVVNTGGIAGLSIAFATYFSYFVPVGPTEIRFIAITGLAIVTTINILGVKIGGVFSDLFTILKLAGIAFLIVAGLGFGTRNPFGDDAGLTDSPLSWASFAIAMVGVLWSYGGWQHASFTAGEARNPSRGVPVAMVAGAVIVTAVYLLANTAYLAILSPQQMGTSTRVASDAMDSAVGALGAGIISLAIFLSTFGSTGIYTLTVPRIYHAMASDGLFFRKVAELHPRYHTPAFAILLQSAWAAILILFWGTFSDVISYVVFTDWIFFGMAGAAVFVLRKKDPHRQRPYKTWGYPITPLIFVSVSLWFVVNTLIEQPLQAWAGLVLLGLGIPVYHYWRRKNL